jgi:hypothetical protein
MSYLVINLCPQKELSSVSKRIFSTLPLRRELLVLGLIKQWEPFFIFNNTQHLRSLPDPILGKLVQPLKLSLFMRIVDSRRCKLRLRLLRQFQRGDGADWRLKWAIEVIRLHQLLIDPEFNQELFDQKQGHKTEIGYFCPTPRKGIVSCIP